MGEARLGSFGALYAPMAPETPRYPRVARASPPPPRHVLRIPGPIRDQGTLGSCTGEMRAMATAIEVGYGLYSPLAAYYHNRIMSGFPPGQDSGAYVDASMLAGKKWGIGSELLWPYEIARFAVAPEAEYLQQAADHRILEWYGAKGVAEAKAALWAGHPVCVGFDVPPIFSEVGTDGLWREDGRTAVGGHAVVLYGYDDEAIGGKNSSTPGCFAVVNSWGNDWGEPIWDQDHLGPGGGFRIPYSAFSAAGRVWNVYVATLIDAEAGR